MLLTALALSSHAFSADKPAGKPTDTHAVSGAALKSCTSAKVDAPVYVVLGKSTVIPLDFPASRIVVGGSPASRAVIPNEPADKNDKSAAMGPPQTAGSDGVGHVDIALMGPNELFVLGKKAGSMNVVLQGTGGRCTIKDIIVTVDPNSLQAKLGLLMPEETGIKVHAAENALVLSGIVSDAVKLDEAVRLASSYVDGKKVVNLLRLSTPQQVMLEVKIAEVSKSLLDKFGINFARLYTTAGGTSRILSGIFGGGPAILGQFRPNVASALTGAATGAIGGGSGAAAASLSTAGSGASLLGIDAEKKDGLVRILAEPNIMAISGQSASFLSGGRIFIPVAQSNTGGGSTITLEEKEFGVGLKFMPTVLAGGKVNLKLVSEVSELSQTGSPFTTVNGVTSVLPSITTRRIDTTVQLGDGQSFAIAGLIRNNITETISRFPGLGEIPLLGALFRSTEFQKDQTELIFIVTPRMVKPMQTAAALPTDNHIEPNRSDVLFMGSAEGKAKETVSPGNP
ncbi:type II and III secretion system protein family protein [Janthinobacterium sp. 17J80-10]|uniref:type II and III secretion system protein family protein n=1 Tax=Janthinobacterium sp. 17J80-10 TaxID=2497863 RepID=UPI0010058BF5|nr:type II and III secretion system protein family protein [Janthinobacterium sp. 17J80-10]QAU33457.1 type II and III secretion system protein family protein [Janthinobacterium sp. 17J80-10]